MINNSGNIGEKIWTKNFSLMMVIAFLMGIANNMFVGALPLYVLRHGGDSSMAGAVMSVFTLSALCCRHFWGRMLDGKGRKKVLIAGGILYTLISVVYSFAFTIPMIILIRFLHGVGYGAHSTASGTIVSDLVPKSRLSEGIGYYGISSTLATAVGPALGLFISEKYSYPALFEGICLLSIISLTGSLFLNYEKKPDIQIAEKRSEKPDKVRKIIEPTAIPASIVIMFVTISMSGIFSFLSAFGVEKEIENIGMFFSVYACAILTVRLLFSQLSSHIEITKLLIAAMFLSFLALVWLAFASNLSSVLFSGMLYGAGMGIIQPVMNSILVMQCPANRRGAANATYFSAIDIGYTIGPVLLGIILKFTGFSVVYMVSAIAILLSVLSYLLMVKGSGEMKSHI